MTHDCTVQQNHIGPRQVTFWPKGFLTKRYFDRGMFLPADSMSGIGVISDTMNFQS